jgi:hypothetical protein
MCIDAMLTVGKRSFGNHDRPDASRANAIAFAQNANAAEDHVWEVLELSKNPRKWDTGIKLKLVSSSSNRGIGS